MLKWLNLTKHPLAPGALLVALLVLLPIIATTEHRLPSRVPQDTNIIIQLEGRRVPAEQIVAVLVALYPDLRELFATVEHKTRSSVLALAASTLHGARVIIATGDRVPNLTIIVRGTKDDARVHAFEWSAAQALSRLYPTPTTRTLPDQTTAEDQIADPSHFAFTPMIIAGARARVIMTSGAPSFAHTKVSGRQYFSTSVQDLKVMLNDPSTPYTKSRDFICVMPTKNVKVWLNPTNFQVVLSSPGDELLTRIVKQNDRVVFPSSLPCY